MPTCFCGTQIFQYVLAHFSRATAATILSKHHYSPQRSCEGYVFTGVCLSTGGMPGPGGCLLPGGVPGPRGVGVPACTEADPRPQETATAADGTHPTEMHSCFEKYFAIFIIPYQC